MKGIYVLKLRAVCQIGTREALALFVVSLIGEVEHRLTTKTIHLQQEGKQDDVDVWLGANPFLSAVLAYKAGQGGHDVPVYTHQ